jgi:hypothetical protein
MFFLIPDEQTVMMIGRLARQVTEVAKAALCPSWRH